MRSGLRDRRGDFPASPDCLALPIAACRLEWPISDWDRRIVQIQVRSTQLSLPRHNPGAAGQVGHGRAWIQLKQQSMLIGVQFPSLVSFSLSRPEFAALASTT